MRDWPHAPLHRVNVRAGFEPLGVDDAPKSGVKPPHSEGFSTDGFTFVEVLIALLLCTLLVSVICTSLIRIANARLRIHYLDLAALEVQRIACMTYLDKDPFEADGTQRRHDWSARQRDVSGAALESPHRWRTWTVAPAEDPGFTTSFSLRADVPPWPPRPDDPSDPSERPAAQ